MKHICRTEMSAANEAHASTSSKRCTKFLSEWAKDCKLIVPTFFFWNSGVTLQMTQAGLFRSLLAQILEQAPDLIPVVSPKRWEALCLFNEDAMDWTDHELQQILRLAAKNLTNKAKMCLFIDGLDEFDGDHSVLIRLCKDLIAVPTVKLCVSSRPWVVFEDAFQHAPSLMLQDLTYPDIMHYVTSHFYGDSGFTLLREREPSYADQLVDNLVAKASGVFLWVRLVVSSLLSGLGHGDRISDLQRRLDFLPPELEELYDKMLSSLDPFYLEHAAQLFKLLRESPNPPTLLLLALTDEEKTCQLVLDRAIRAMSDKEADTLFETMRRRLNSRCKGLLEVAMVYRSLVDDTGGLDLHKCTVQYLHRTVKDYVESPDVQRKLESAMKMPFDPHLNLCAGNLALLKTMEQNTIHFQENDVFWKHVTQFMLSATKVSPSNHTQLIRLMDDLDKTGSILAKFVAAQEHREWPGEVGRSKQQLLELGQWVAVHPVCDLSRLFGAHFLSLAVRCGVTAYVQAKANKGCLIQVIRKGGSTAPGLGQDTLIVTRIHSLLLDAFSAAAQNNYGCTVPDYSMVTCLLTKGANPNAELIAYNGLRTVWEVAWEAITAETSSSLSSSWIEVAALMMEHGAGHYSKQERKRLLGGIIC